MNIADPTICLWEPAPYLFFSENIWGNFIYYSHLFPVVSGLIIALVVFFNNPKSKPAQALLFTVMMFTIWSFLDLILWATDRSDIIMFIWSSLIYFDLLIYIGSLYFIYAYFNNKFIPLRYELLLFTLFIPYFLFAHTSLNLTGFDFTNCWREAIEGPLWTHYTYTIELLIGLVIIVLSYKELRLKKRKDLETLSVSFGTLFFLISFSIGNILGSLQTDWEIGQIGLFGMPIFVAILAYSILRFHTFRIKILAAEALMMGLAILLVSLFFVRTIENSRIIAVVTLILFSFFGMLLVRSIRREVIQREQIEKLAESLEKANARLRDLDRQKSEFVSIASHQLRSPLAAMRGYASMMLEGSFGAVTDKQKEVLKQVQDSGKMMASSIEDYLSISRIESGNMKYELSDFNLKELTFQLTEELQAEAKKTGLILHFVSELAGEGIVNADRGKTYQVIHNLVNNSIKYTPKGTTTVLVKDDQGKKTISVIISDTGIGMNQVTLSKIFEKFSRAENANQVNIKGTGLGLYVARALARAMHGEVKAESEGDGKGSTFTFTLPLVK